MSTVCPIISNPHESFNCVREKCAWWIQTLTTKGNTWKGCVHVLKGLKDSKGKVPETQKI